jgi:hypothetical protein
MPAFTTEPSGYSMATMTLIYGTSYYHLSEDAVTVAAAGGAPEPVELAALPLPVARVLQAWRTQSPLRRAA